MKRLPRIDLRKEVKLDIGCGTNPQKDFIGIDVKDCGQEVLWDIRQGIPFPDNSVSEIYTCHFLEHLAVDEDIEFLKEVFRTLKTGGIFRNYTPHANGICAFFPGHKTFWNERRIVALQDSNVGHFKIIKNEKIFRDKRVGDELYFILEKK